MKSYYGNSNRYNPYLAKLQLELAFIVAFIILCGITIAFFYGLIQSLFTCSSSPSVKDFLKSFTDPTSIKGTNEFYCAIPTVLRIFYLATNLVAVLSFIIYNVRRYNMPDNLTPEEIDKYNNNNKTIFLIGLACGAPLYIPLIIALIILVFTIFLSFN